MEFSRILKKKKKSDNDCSKLRSNILLSRRRGEPIDTSSSKAKKETEQDEQLSRELFGDVEKFGKGGVKDNLSPKQEGDRKDCSCISCLDIHARAMVDRKTIMPVLHPGFPGG